MGRKGALVTVWCVLRADRVVRHYGAASKILSCIKLCGKSPEKPKGFFWSVQGGPGEIEIPPGLVFFSQSFLLEKQKKMLDGSRKFLIWVLTLKSALLTANQYREVFYVPAVCARSAA